MTVSEMADELALREYGALMADELALKGYEVLRVDELKDAIVNIEYQKMTDRYIDEAKLRIVRQKQNANKNYKSTDEEIMELLRAKTDADE